MSNYQIPCARSEHRTRQSPTSTVTRASQRDGRGETYNIPVSVPNLFYAQSGGVTPVINATAYGVIQEARKHEQVGKVYAGINGILGALHEELVDTDDESPEAIRLLRHTPGGAFGSCRHKLPDPAKNSKPYRRLLEVFAAHQIGYFLYNGGGDSQDTTDKIDRYSQNMGYQLQCIGIPKTIDNDLPHTDNSPGFATVAKYIATSTREVGLDIASMCASSTKVFVLEVMGRHAGWIAAAAGLAARDRDDPPHIILFPEIPFVEQKFIEAVQRAVTRHGYCMVVASEGVRDTQGNFLSATRSQDSFGHAQLGGVAPYLAERVRQHLAYKYHWAVADYLQRAARHLGSAVDVAQAEATGQVAVKLAVAGKSGVMPVIERTSNKPYKWRVTSAEVSTVANREKKIPRDWISEDGFGINRKTRDYLLPLIEGEDYPPQRGGLPVYARLALKRLDKKLPTYQDS